MLPASTNEKGIKMEQAFFYTSQGKLVDVQPVRWFGMQYLCLAYRCNRIGADYFTYKGQAYEGKEA